jgi:hypothetical protein
MALLSPYETLSLNSADILEENETGSPSSNVLSSTVKCRNAPQISED